jgi:peptidoglycan/LPS O-acetylase OafA/YrhL
MIIEDRRKDETSSPLVPDPTLPGRAGRHYPALDGIRGMAILLVLVFHGFLGLNWTFSFDAKLAQVALAGWVGVDVFFVLSWFLITGILLDSRASPQRLLNFYSRRFLRIFPIYWAMLAFVFFVIPLFKPFDTPGLAMIRENQGWIWTYLTNVGYVVHQRAWATADWLDLGHLWSLAIEEQFYVVWPFLVFFAPVRWLKVVCIVCIIGSPALRCALWLLDMRPGALYFPTPCRLDGLAIGALVATLLRERSILVSTGSLRMVAAAGGVLVAGIVFWRAGFNFNDRPTIVFGISGICLLTASAIVLAVDPKSRVSYLFSNPVLRSAGKYSYAAYLFHVPLRAPLAALLPDSVLTATFHSQLVGRSIYVAALIVVSFASALLSWHLYEKH